MLKTDFQLHTEKVVSVLMLEQPTLEFIVIKESIEYDQWPQNIFKMVIIFLRIFM